MFQMQHLHSLIPRYALLIITYPLLVFFKFKTLLIRRQHFHASVQRCLKLLHLKGLQQDCKFENPLLLKIFVQMSLLGFQRVNLPTYSLFRFLRFLLNRQKFHASVKLQRRLKLALLKGFQQNLNFENPILLQISLQISVLGFQRVNLTTARLF